MLMIIYVFILMFIYLFGIIRLFGWVGFFYGFNILEEFFFGMGLEDMINLMFFVCRKVWN